MILKVQEYLRSGKSLEDLTSELGMKRNTLDGLVLLNYSQTDSPKIHPIVMECRALVLEIDTWDLISMGYKRFFNHCEAKEVTDDFPFHRSFAIEKVDGCCHENTKIQTENGEKTIREICETRYSGKILSIDINTNNKKFIKIENFSIGEEESEWYEIELEDGTTVCLTENHYVWIPELNCFRKVKDLTGEEGLLVEKVV
jgi:hypothetical protein